MSTGALPGRWHVIITWIDRTCPDVHRIEYLADLPAIVERGRDWFDIAKIEIRMVRRAQKSQR